MTAHSTDDRFCPNCGYDQTACPSESHYLLPGTMLRNRYRIGRVLGEGGFGITYVGWDTVLNLKVAVKEFYMSGYVGRMNQYSLSVQVSMSTHGEIFTKNRNRFLDEARVLAKFADEAGIVGIRDFFEENNTAYIVMTFLDGVTLKEYLKQHGRLSWAQTFSIMRPILTSLCTVHEQGIIHRDISPDNIMLTNRGQVKLLDFGAARDVSGNDAHSLSIILKPGFAPEEQYRTKGHQGPWTDVYALCATMYRCITGVTPDESTERTYFDKIRPPHELCSCPPAVSQVLMKGLSVYAQDRYPTVAALLGALQAAGQGNPTVSARQQPPVTPPPVQTPQESERSGKNRALLIAIAIVSVLLIGLLALLIFGTPADSGSLFRPDPEESTVAADRKPQDDTPAPSEPADLQEEPENAETAPPAETEPDSRPETEAPTSPESDSGDVSVPTVSPAPTAPSPAPEEPQSNPLENLDIEAEVSHIRDINTAFVTQMNAGEYTVLPVRSGIAAYVEEDKILSIQVSAGTDGNSYARSYYYDELGRLYFAYYSGTDSHRCYFYEGQLFRWRYMQDASDAATAVNHDLENSAAFSEQQTLVQQDSDAFLSEAAALMGTG